MRRWDTSVHKQNPKIEHISTGHQAERQLFWIRIHETIAERNKSFVRSLAEHFGKTIFCIFSGSKLKLVIIQTHTYLGKL